MLGRQSSRFAIVAFCAFFGLSGTGPGAAPPDPARAGAGVSRAPGGSAAGGPQGPRGRADVVLLGGPVYTMKEIERLCYGTKSA